jgi:hypothetical protein
VAAAERRRGRRDNGLDAADWRAVEDLDPRVSEDVLDVLGSRGIAAYVQPAMDVDPITRSTTVPSRPSDRLYVDREYVEAARAYLRELLDRPRRATTELDVTFAGIVADFNRPVDPTAASWPSAENTPVDPTTVWPTAEEVAVEPEPTPAAAGPVDARDLTESTLLEGLDPAAAYDYPDELPETFVPPPPPPLPRLSRQAVLGGLAIVVGLVLVLGQPDVLSLDRSTTILLGFASILGGAVALILRLRPGTDPEEQPPPNDGAQV